MILLKNEDVQKLKWTILKYNPSFRPYIDDIVQDLMIEKNTRDECFAKYKSALEKYCFVSNLDPFDTTKNISENSCIHCGEVKPKAMFRQLLGKNNCLYISNVCKSCLYDRYDKHRRKKINATQKKWRKENKELVRKYEKKNREKKKKRLNEMPETDRNKYLENRKIYFQNYYKKNKEEIKKRVRENYKKRKNDRKEF